MGKRENKIEIYLHDKIVALGGTTRKFASPGKIGVADRLVLMPGGKVYFIEIKIEDGIESSPQKKERLRMISLGFDAFVLYGINGVKNFINFCEELK